MRAFAPLLVLLALVPSATAQAPSVGVPATLEIEMDAPTEPVETDRPVTFPYRVTLTVDGPSTGEVEVALSSSPPPQWELAFQPPSHRVSVGPLPGSYVLEGTATVLAHGDAPALEEETLPVTVSTGGNAVVAPADADAQPTFKAAWRPGLRITVRPSSVGVPEEGGTARALAEAINTGNGPITLRVAPVAAPAGCEATPEGNGLRIEAGTRAPVAVRIECEDGWQSGALIVRYRHLLALDETQEGSPVEPAWDVGLPGSGDGGPRSFGDGARDYAVYDSPWPALAAPAGLALGALLRRRRVGGA